MISMRSQLVSEKVISIHSKDYFLNFLGLEHFQEKLLETFHFLEVGHEVDMLMIITVKLGSQFELSKITFFNRMLLF